FRGQHVVAVKETGATLSPATASCLASGNGAPIALSMFRADVLRYLPLQRDASGNPTGKRLVNDADLQAAGFPLHTVKLPDSGTGNGSPTSAGATLLVVYRDPAQPLT